jgi:streptogramin lyase
MRQKFTIFTLEQVLDMKKLSLKFGVAVLGLTLLSAAWGQAQPTTTGVLLKDFVNHGIPAKVSESRGIFGIRDKAGTPLIIAIARDHYLDNPRSSLLVIDAKTGKTQQYWYPVREKANGDVFSLLRAPDGMIYTTMGNTLVEFDLEKREFTYNGEVDGMAMSFARSDDGSIYFGTYPNSSLYRFDPKVRKLEKLVQLDPKEQYPLYMAAGAAGWIYSGLGTARSNIVAYNPQSGELKQLVDEAARKTGTSYVFNSTDGNIYGREVSAEAGRLMKLEGGAATFVEGNPANPQRAVTGGLNWGNMLSVFPTGKAAIVSLSVPEKTAEVLLDGIRERINFDYESEGPSISSLITGPDGKVYGSTNHPMHIFAFNPKPSTLADLGPITQVAGGNFPAFAVSGMYIVGDSYAAGAVYELDTTQAWEVPATGDTVNPRLIGKYNEVTRPRASVALPNGDVLFGGYGGYGVTGGGLVTYHADTRQASVKPAAELLPNQSTIALALVNNKTVVGGTAVWAPGGGRVLAREGELYLYDTATQQITFHTVPVPGAAGILDIYVHTDGKVYGLTDTQQLFVFDPQTREVIHRADWKQWGMALNPGHSLWRAPNGHIGVLLPKVILEIQPDYSVRKIGDTPALATSGGVVANNRLFFGTGSSLQSVSLAPLAP